MASSPPHQRTTMLRIGRQQTVQNRGAATRQSYDEQRLPDFLARDVGILLPVPFHQQARTQYLQKVDPERDSSNQVEACLPLTGLEQARQRFKKNAFAKIVQTAASLCSFD